ncbi:MAG TPA: Gfo/Idh/MocA family oxidoreductase [Burkholderiales bacterium]|nr:Gfo/Idh/MocA family oxidoreductase [Burkholderiales bacterium]
MNVAVVGLGWWGRIIVDLLVTHPRFRLIMGIDVSADAAGFVRERKIALSGDLEEAMRDPAVHAVILCTPHSQHADQIVRAASAKKHVFCEKPLSLSRVDVLRAIDACNTNKVVLGVGHEKRFEPPIQELMRLARSGELGTLLQVEANFSQDKFLSLPADNWRLSSREAPAGPMTATGIHLLDLSVALLGPAERAFAAVRQLGSPLANGDTLGVLVSFRSGANALLGAMLATPFVGRFAVFGNRGWAEVRDKAHPEAPEGWTLTTCARGGKPQTRDYPPARAVVANLEAFADAVEGSAAYPVPQEQMIANISALEAVFRSAASGRVETVEN